MCLLKFLSVGVSWISPTAYGCGFHIVANVSQESLCSDLSLVGMHSAVASM